MLRLDTSHCCFSQSLFYKSRPQQVRSSYCLQLELVVALQQTFKHGHKVLKASGSVLPWNYSISMQRPYQSHIIHVARAHTAMRTLENTANIVILSGCELSRRVSCFNADRWLCSGKICKPFDKCMFKGLHRKK